MVRTLWFIYDRTSQRWSYQNLVLSVSICLAEKNPLTLHPKVLESRNSNFPPVEGSSASTSRESELKDFPKKKKIAGGM